MPGRKKLRRTFQGPLDSFFTKPTSEDEEHRRRKVSTNSALSTLSAKIASADPGSGEDRLQQGGSEFGNEAREVSTKVHEDLPQKKTDATKEHEDKPLVHDRAAGTGGSGKSKPIADAAIAKDPPASGSESDATEEMEDATGHVHHAVHVECPGFEEDRWDSFHVHLPCSSQHTYYHAPSKKRLSRWYLVKTVLSTPKKSSMDIEEAILTINPAKRGRWDFSNLHSYVASLSGTEKEHLFSVLIPGIVKLALSLSTLFPRPVPLLTRQRSATVTLSQRQIAALLANGFFCTFPQSKPGYSHINFHGLFSGFDAFAASTGDGGKMRGKLRCIMHYFDRVVSEAPREGKVSFQRVVLRPAGMPVWSVSRASFGGLEIRNSGSIEDAEEGVVQIDFANKVIGGGVLASGCVQEEIMMLGCVEMVAGRLLAQPLEGNEALAVVGAERFSATRGYATSFEWEGPFRDAVAMDAVGRRRRAVVAIDSLNFREHPANAQFSKEAFDRELIKAYCGFSAKDHIRDEKCHLGLGKRVATGHWGCGVFEGDKYLKLVIQLLAAGQAEKDLIYYTFGEDYLGETFIALHRAVASASVGEVYSAVAQWLDGDCFSEGETAGEVLARRLLAQFETHAPEDGSIYCDVTTATDGDGDDGDTTIVM